MNKFGQTLGIAIISSIFVFIIGLLFLNFLMPEITDFRVNMNCADAANITDGTKLLCLCSSSLVPYFIILVFSITIGGVTSRLTL